MKKYLKNLGTSILDGFYSIAKGMSTFSIYPVDKKIPSDEEAYQKDYEAIKSYWDFVLKGKPTRIEDRNSVEKRLGINF